MDYYILSISPDVKKTIKPHDCSNIFKGKILTLDNLDGIDYLRASKYTKDKNTEESDIIVNPIYMISNKFKILIKEYYIDLETIAIQFLDQNNETLLYWVPAVENLDCISDITLFNPDMTIKDLYIDSKKIQDKKIFKIKNVLEPFLIVDLYIAEKILQSDLYGVLLRKVKVV